MMVYYIGFFADIILKGKITPDQVAKIERSGITRLYHEVPSQFLKNFGSKFYYWDGISVVRCLTSDADFRLDEDKKFVLIYPRSISLNLHDLRII